MLQCSIRTTWAVHVGECHRFCLHVALFDVHLDVSTSYDNSKWFLDKLGHEGLNNMLAAYDDKTAFAQCIFSLCSGPGQPVITFAGKCPVGPDYFSVLCVLFCAVLFHNVSPTCWQGKIVAARGPNHFGWDPVFEADGTGKTCVRFVH